MIQLPNTIHEYAFIAYPSPNDEDLVDHVGAGDVAAVIDGGDLEFSTYGVQHNAALAVGAIWNPGATYSLIYLFNPAGDTTPLMVSFDSGDSIVISVDSSTKKAVVSINGSDTDLLTGYFEGYGAVGVAVNQTLGNVRAVAEAVGRHQLATILDAPSGTINGVTFGDTFESVWLAVGDEYWDAGSIHAAYRALRLKVLRRGLSMPAFNSAGAVTHPIGMADCRRTLTREISAILKSHDSTFRIEERLRTEVFGSTGADRDNLMGDPVRYCDVLYMGSEDSGSQVELGRGSDGQTEYRFLVTLFYGYADGTDYASSSQAGFDALLEDPETGLLPQLRRMATMDIAGEDIDGSGPGNLPPDVEAGDVALLGQPERADVDHNRDSHWARFEITVTTQF